MRLDFVFVKFKCQKALYNYNLVLILFYFYDVNYCSRPAKVRYESKSVIDVSTLFCKSNLQNLLLNHSLDKNLCKTILFFLLYKVFH